MSSSYSGISLPPLPSFSSWQHNSWSRPPLPPISFSPSTTYPDYPSIRTWNHSFDRSPISLPPLTDRSLVRLDTPIIGLPFSIAQDPSLGKVHFDNLFDRPAVPRALYTSQDKSFFLWTHRTAQFEQINTLVSQTISSQSRPKPPEMPSTELSLSKFKPSHQNGPFLLSQVFVAPAPIRKSSVTITLIDDESDKLHAASKHVSQATSGHWINPGNLSSTTGSMAPLDPTFPKCHVFTWQQENGLFPVNFTDLKLMQVGRSLSAESSCFVGKQDPFSLRDFSLGFARGLPRGIHDSGTGLFSFVSDLVKHPMNTGAQVLESLTLLSHLARTQQWAVLGEALAPEINQLVKNWDTLSSRKRGELSGYAFGKYGADILIPGVLAKTVSKSLKGAQELNIAYKGFQRAEQTLLLEAAGGAALTDSAKAGKILQTEARLVGKQTHPPVVVSKEVLKHVKFEQAAYSEARSDLESISRIAGEETQAAGSSLKAGKFTYTGTTAKHFTEFVKKGTNAGRLSRPYMRSQLAIEEIMAAGKPIPDPGGIPGGLRWDISGTFRGNTGTWELVIHPETGIIYHFNFK